MSIKSLSIAPMVDWTNTHFRVMMRMIAPKALLYTEMEPVHAVLNRRPRALYFDPIEHPIAIQLGGSKLSALVDAVKIAEEASFDEVNLNLGCPSDRVKSGQFGAVLMREGEHVAACIRAMKKHARMPITIKMRTGVDELDSYDHFKHLADLFVEAGIDKLIIHARKAWLTGISPKDNRTLPPLQYDFVYRLKEAYPTLPIIINGQLNTLEVIQDALQRVDGVMIGRLCCQDPYALADIHALLYPDIALKPRLEVIHDYVDYAYQQGLKGVKLTILCKPLMNMMHGLPYAKRWKHALMQVVREQSLDKLLGIPVMCSDTKPFRCE